jgi:hypothetical protein
MGTIEVRQYFENKGFFPEKVARVGIGHLKAESIPPGGYKRIEASSIEALFKQPELAKKHIERLVAKKSAKTKIMKEEDLDLIAKRAKAPRPNRDHTPASARSPVRGMNSKREGALDENFRFRSNSGVGAKPSKQTRAAKPTIRFKHSK